MPLAHTPFRPKPVVEFLGAKPISAKEAARGLSESVEIDSASSPEIRYELPGSTMVNFRQIPGIIEALQTDWVDVPGDQQPADCFVEVRGRLETHMHPCFLGEKLVIGLRGAAGTLLLRFNPTLKCVPLGFSRLLPAGTHGAIVGVSPYVHFLADFRAIGFVPKKDQWLLGRPSERQTAQGVNILILNCFNMFVRRHHLPAALRFDDEKECWVFGEKAHRLRAKRGPVWVQSTGVLQVTGPVPSLFGHLPWPPFVAEHNGSMAPEMASGSKEDTAASVPVDAGVAAEVPAGQKGKRAATEQAKTNRKGKDKGKDAPPAMEVVKPTAKVRKDKESDTVQAVPTDHSAVPRKRTAPTPMDNSSNHKKGGKTLSGGASSGATTGFRKEALASGTLKRRRDTTPSAQKLAR